MTKLRRFHDQSRNRVSSKKTVAPLQFWTRPAHSTEKPGELKIPCGPTLRVLRKSSGLTLFNAQPEGLQLRHPSDPARVQKRNSTTPFHHFADKHLSTLASQYLPRTMPVSISLSKVPGGADPARAQKKSTTPFHHFVDKHLSTLTSQHLPATMPVSISKSKVPVRADLARVQPSGLRLRRVSKWVFASQRHTPSMTQRHTSSRTQRLSPLARGSG